MWAATVPAQEVVIIWHAMRKVAPTVAPTAEAADCQHRLVGASLVLSMEKHDEVEPAPLAPDIDFFETRSQRVSLVFAQEYLAAVEGGVESMADRCQLSSPVLHVGSVVNFSLSSGTLIGGILIASGIYDSCNSIVAVEANDISCGPVTRIENVDIKFIEVSGVNVGQPYQCRSRLSTTPAFVEMLLRHYYSSRTLSSRGLESSAVPSLPALASKKPFGTDIPEVVRLQAVIDAQELHIASLHAKCDRMSAEAALIRINAASLAASSQTRGNEDTDALGFAREDLLRCFSCMPTLPCSNSTFQSAVEPCLRRV